MKFNSNKFGIISIVSFAAWLLWASLGVQAETPRFTISVKGLACPFCVYGLEKKLKKVDGVKSVKIDLKSGTALVIYQNDFKPDLAELQGAVKKAGFTPGKIKPASKQSAGTKEDAR